VNTHQQIKAYSYVRFSTPEQANGDSLRRQAAASEEYATKNGLVLDTVLKMRDCGVSAYRGQNRTAGGGLAAFISEVEAGCVPRGSYLLVESLDRLSREQINKALKLFLHLLEKGIVIVTLMDGQKYDEASVGDNPTSLMMSLVVMWRAHEESKTKSERVCKAAEQRRKNLGTKKYTRTCPSWLKYDRATDQFSIVEERATLVRWMFTQADKGIGVFKIATMLRDKGVDTWQGSDTFKDRKARKWHYGTIDTILNSEAVIGRFVPHKIVDGKRIPAGDPVLDYFPRLITDALFERVRRHASTNRKRPGRIGSKVGNLFTFLAFCARTGAPAIFVDKGDGWAYIKADGDLPDGRHMKGWPIRAFEEFFLSGVGGLDLGRILGDNDATLLEVESRLGKAQLDMREVNRRLATLTAAIEEGGEMKSLVGRIKELESQKEELSGIVRELEGRALDERAVLSSAELTAGNLKKLINEKSPEKRLLLRQEIRRIVKRIDIVFEVEPTAEERAEQKMLAEKVGALRQKGGVFAEIGGKGRAAAVTFINGVVRRLEEVRPGVAALASENDDETVVPAVGTVASGRLIFQPGLVPPTSRKKGS